MKINLHLGGQQVQELSFNVADLKTTWDSMDLGEGSPNKPISLDHFVQQDKLYGIPDIILGNELIVKLNQQETLQGPSFFLCYCCIRNVDKSRASFISEPTWGDIFDLNNEQVKVTPDGVIYVKANKSGECRINTKTGYNGIMFISYTIVFSITYQTDALPCFYKIDPFAKIRSEDPLS